MGQLLGRVDVEREVVEESSDGRRHGEPAARVAGHGLFFPLSIPSPVFFYHLLFPFFFYLDQRGGTEKRERQREKLRLRCDWRGRGVEELSYKQAVFFFLGLWFAAPRKWS